MARYHFDIFNDEDTVAEEGTELGAASAVQERNAVQAASRADRAKTYPACSSF
jgi:hypothetical protein